MRQRVSMARTLAAEPKIMLMDEPFAALDEQTRLLLGDKVLQIQQQLKQTTLLITHNITEAVQLSDRIVVMTYRPGKVKRIVDIDLPRPRTSEIVSSEAFGRYVAQIWSDLREEATRGLPEDEAKTLHRASAHERRGALTRALVPVILGFGSFAGVILLVEIFIRIGVINRFIVPMPSEIFKAFPRVVVGGERALALPRHRRRGVFGEHPGQPLRRCQRRAALPVPPAAGRHRDLGGGDRGGAAGADLSALPRDLRPQRHHHRDDGLQRRRRAGDAENAGRPFRHAARADQCRRSFNLTRSQQFWKILFPAALPTIFVGLRLGLIFALINIVGVEFLINFGGLGQLINELAERYDLPGTYAAICFVILVSVCVFVLLERLERWLRPIE